MSRADRLLRLVQLLRRYRTPVSAATLARELEVSVRSVYRDVETLRAQGASIEGEAGLGYVLLPGFLLPPLMFADEELEAVALGLRLAAEHGDSGIERAAAEVLAKLRAVLPRDLQALLDDTGLLAGPARARPEEVIDLREVRRALRLERKALIEYEDQHGVASSRTVWPVAIGFFERSRVIAAWCELRQDFRSFRADRIKSFKLLGAGYPRARAALLRDFRARERIAAQVGDRNAR